MFIVKIICLLVHFSVATVAYIIEVSKLNVSMSRYVLYGHNKLYCSHAPP